MTFDLWSDSRDHVRPESRIGVCRLRLTLSAQFPIFFWCGFQGPVKVRSKSLTFDDLASLFRVLHVSMVVSGADFEFPFGDL